MKLKGRVALVTGSTSGIGLGIARVLAEAGADIALNGFADPAEVEALRSGFERDHGVRCAFFEADISDPDAAAAMAEQVAAALGGPDILVNNAGVQHTASIEDFPIEQWNRILAVNLSGAFFLMRSIMPRMRAKGWGRVVNIASAHGTVASVEKAGYVAAKHGLVGLTKVAALEYANAGITVNAVNPGWVMTPLVEKQIAARAKETGREESEEAEALLAEKQEMRRFSTPEHIGAAVRFLCSAGAETITGTTLAVDGGWTAR